MMFDIIISVVKDKTFYEISDQFKDQICSQIVFNSMIGSEKEKEDFLNDPNT